MSEATQSMYSKLREKKKHFFHKRESQQWSQDENDLQPRDHRTEKQKNKDEHHYFKGHTCYIPLDEQTKTFVTCGKFRKFILHLTSVRCGDIRVQRMYKSYAEISAAEYNHFMYYPCSIHPYSRLRFFVEVITIIALQTTYIISAINVSFVKSIPCLNIIVKTCEVLFLLNILSNLFTGYVVGKISKHVVLDLKRILLRYFRFQVFLDLLFISNLLISWNQFSTWVGLVFACFKIFQIPTLLSYASNVAKVMRIGELLKTILEISLHCLNYLCWNIFFQFYTEYIIEGSKRPENPRPCSWLTISAMWNDNSFNRLVYAFVRAVAMLRQNSNLKVLNSGMCFEAFFLVSWIIARVLVVHCALKFMLMIYGRESARAKYYMMTKQVEVYMDQRKFPDRLKKKILKYYAIRYRSLFIEEERFISCMSGQLREDIIMHSGRRLVQEVEFLKKLPRSLLLQIGIKLKVDIFLEGDIIFKINTVGNCLYFVDKGTVAVYSEVGREICHLQDGDFFGEIALIHTGFQTASAVAVTNCELFRLDKQDFNSTIARYPTVYEEIKKIAALRFEKTQALDEYYRTELKLRKNY